MEGCRTDRMVVVHGVLRREVYAQIEKSAARQSYVLVSDVQSNDAESKDVESVEGVDDVCLCIGLQVERQCPCYTPQSQYDHHHVLGQHEGSHSG